MRIRAEIAAASDAPMQRRPIDEGREGERPGAPSAFMDATLAPESRVELPSHGTKIVHARVTDTEGVPVNHLRAGEVYVYEYEVDFSEPAHAVRFGMMVKPVTGMELGGQVTHPEGSGLATVRAGTRLRVRFPFRAALSPGAYFLNAGVLGRCEGEERYLHRILDATMFRVMPERPGRMTGRVDLTVAGDEPAIEDVTDVA